MVEASVALGGLSLVVAVVLGIGRIYKDDLEILDKNFKLERMRVMENLEDDGLDSLQDVLTPVVQYEIERDRQLTGRTADAKSDVDRGQDLMPSYLDGGAESGQTEKDLSDELDEENTTAISLTDVIEDDSVEFEQDIDDDGELLRELYEDIREPIERWRRLQRIPSEHTDYQQKSSEWYDRSLAISALATLGFGALWHFEVRDEGLIVLGALLVLAVLMPIGLVVYYNRKARKLKNKFVNIIQEEDVFTEQ